MGLILDLELPPSEVEFEVEIEVVAQEEAEEVEAEAESVDLGETTSSHRSQFVLSGDRLLRVDVVVEGVSPAARDEDLDMDPDLEDEGFAFSPMTPTYISGPLFERTSWKRQRRGQLHGFPGRGSLGQIQPRV